ncbi:MAG: M20/M25/M40 family metallo-hydrolase [Planctomycetes bacterium]|nr:M20/M25/M40 family metallo-hydrolase [Planctomycetota bacterium]
MDDAALRRWLTDLCAVDTTSGQEDAGLDPLQALLRALGADVELQPVAPGRTNVLARWGAPRVLLTTHLDTVPPFIAPRWEGDVLWGRGACDAKGQAVAQLAAIDALVRRGARGLAWLGVVGEETDSAGAQAALALRPALPDLAAVIDGEPTEGALATGQRGVVHVRLRCRGRAAHSGTPERGRSALWPLLDWLAALRGLPQATDAELGPELWNLGLLRGGEAPNVVPAHAEADLLLRTLPGSRLLEDVRRLAPPDADVEVLLDEPPDRYPPVPGFPRAAVPFGSDAPRLRALAPGGAVVLAGPGTITVAHSPDERLGLDELRAGVELNARLAAGFLDLPSA